MKTGNSRLSRADSNQPFTQAASNGTCRPASIRNLRAGSRRNLSFGIRTDGNNIPVAQAHAANGELSAPRVAIGSPLCGTPVTARLRTMEIPSSSRVKQS